MNGHKMEDENMKLEKDLFNNVIAYIFGEPGAMGANGMIECLNNTGEVFRICYFDKETSWEKVKECFDGINGCKFNGPDRKAFFSANFLVIGGSKDIVTTIKEGWREICFDCGNHFVCKEEYAHGFIEFFMGMEGYQIICDGMEKIKKEKFYEKLNDIAEEYYKQKKVFKEKN